MLMLQRSLRSFFWVKDKLKVWHKGFDPLWPSPLQCPNVPLTLVCLKSPHRGILELIVCCLGT